MIGATPQERAYLAPFVAFLGLLGLAGAVAHLGEGDARWFFRDPKYWVFPLQTILCTGVLSWFWHYYGWRPPQKLLLTIGVGILVFVLWIAPQQWLGFPPRQDGFDPGFFGADGWPWWLNVGLRFARLVVIVPLVEEIFWRGFLLRFLIREDFTQIPVGTFASKAFGIVTLGFMLEHAMPDWPAAVITGMLYNFVAWRTQSLSACVLAHAVTNGLLGFWVLQTKQWGFW